MSPIIRRSTKKNIPAIHDFIASMFNLSYSHLNEGLGARLFSRELFYNDRNTLYFKKMFTNNASNDCMIALDNNERIVGLVAAERLGPREVEFHSFYVDPSHRGSGLGKRLWEALDNTYNSNTTKTLDVFVDNHKARAIYESWGYVHIEGCVFPFRWAEWPENVIIPMMRYVKRAI